MCLVCTENPTHQGAHVLPSTLVISLLLIIVVLLTIYCLRRVNICSRSFLLHERISALSFPPLPRSLFFRVCVCLSVCVGVRASGRRRGWLGNRRQAVAYG